MARSFADPSIETAAALSLYFAAEQERLNAVHLHGVQAQCLFLQLTFIG
jgi:hypothetical protein